MRLGPVLIHPSARPWKIGKRRGLTLRLSISWR
jgi:hypothetical protein